MRVLHLHAGNLYGGVETLLATLAQRRDLCPEMQPEYSLCFEGRLSRELAQAGVPPHLLGEVRLLKPWSAWRARRRLRELLAQQRPDAAISHNCWSHVLFAPVLRAARVPVLFWAHDAYGGRHWLERWARRTPPDLVLANSRYTEATIGRLFPDVRGEMLYYALTPRSVHQHDVVRRQLREELQTPPQATVILQVSRLERWKGQRLHLEALGRLRERPDWVCWLAGGAQRPHEAVYLAELQAQARALGIAERVRFLGQRADVPNLLAAADIFCQPNTGPEPFGIVFVEALYAGLPVVTTAQGGPVEIVDESCGILVPPGGSAALADSLQRLLEDRPLRHALGAGGPARARQLCDPATQINKVAAVLRGIIKPRLAS